MLNILNSLAPFFEDNYAEMHVRAYARLMKISPPTASKILKKFVADGILVTRDDKGYDLYKACREETFLRLQHLYWYHRLSDCGLIEYLQTKQFNCRALLFGSFSKAEANCNSDIDIAIIGPTAVESFDKFERKLGRKIHCLCFDSFEKIPTNLMNGILNGYVLIRGTYYGLDGMSTK